MDFNEILYNCTIVALLIVTLIVTSALYRVHSV